jgi:surfeit locus 1 family protein
MLSSGLRRAIWPTLIAVPGVVVLLGLGSWQVDRLTWKNDIIAIRAARLDQPAIALPIAGAEQAEHEFRRVVLRGAFRHESEMFLVFAHGKSAGYRVFTAFTTESGQPVLVDRGFVTESRRDPLRRAAGQVATPAQVKGVLRWSGGRGWFVPDNAPERNFWFHIDVAAMARHAGIGQIPPYYVQADETPNPGGWPQGIRPNVEISNPHLHYALTWFGLAAALATIYVLYLLRLGGEGKEAA